jgi:hypothetical protein
MSRALSLLASNQTKIGAAEQNDP